MAKRQSWKGTYTPKNPEKYHGSHLPVFRSSWEYQVMRRLDEHPDCHLWMSEPVEIPYQNPLTGRWTVYVPDFLVQYVDKNNNTSVEMIEIKPLKEYAGFQGVDPKTGKKVRLTEADKLAQIVNAAKWTAAKMFCAKRGWTFRVITEQTLHAVKRR
jgi:hypothetical protein